MEVMMLEAFGRTWLTSHGLGAHGQADVAVPLVYGGAGEKRSAEAMLRMVDGYTAQAARRIAAGETMAYNVDRVRFRAATDAEREALSAELVAQEAHDPLVHGDDAWVDGMQALSRIDDAMRAVLERHEVAGGKFTNRCLSAIVCKQFESFPGRIQMFRDPPRNDHESGWAFICNDQAHNHDDVDNLMLVHVGDAVRMRRVVLPYLILPAGAAVTFDLADDLAAMFPPVEDDAVVKRIVVPEPAPR